MKDFRKEIQELSYINSKIKALTIDKKKIEAKIQAELSEEMENKNMKYVESASEVGKVSLGFRNKIEIDNLGLLKQTVGEDLALGKFQVVVEEKVKITDKNFEKALVALYKENYKEHDLSEILKNLGLSESDIKVVLKKLKGDYLKDKELLNSYTLTDDDLEEELDVIYEHKNWEAVNRYFGNNGVDLEALKQAIYIDETLAFSSKFNTENNTENVEYNED